MQNDGMADMGRMHPRPSETEAKPAEPRGPEYPELHNVDVDKLPALSSMKVGQELILTARVKLTGLEMHEGTEEINYWPKNTADLCILAAEVEPIKEVKTNNKEVDLGELE